MSWRKGQAYGQDLRDRVLRATGRVCEIAARFGVSASYVSRARARRTQLGQSTPGKQCNHVPLRLGPLKAEVLAQVAKAPEQTLVELCQWVQATHGIVLKPSTEPNLTIRDGCSTCHVTLEPMAAYFSARRRTSLSGLLLRSSVT